MTQGPQPPTPEQLTRRRQWQMMLDAVGTYGAPPAPHPKARPVFRRSTGHPLGNFKF